MTYILLFSLFVFAFFLGAFVEHHLERGKIPFKNTPVLTNERKGLSAPAKSVMKSWDELSDDNRPDEDILSMLRALDIKYGVTAVNNHFRVSDIGNYSYEHDGGRYTSLFENYKFSWKSLDGCDHGKRCKFPEYKALADSINGVVKAAKEQAHALEISGVQHNLDAITRVTERMRSEREIIESVTKELS